MHKAFIAEKFAKVNADVSGSDFRQGAQPRFDQSGREPRLQRPGQTASKYLETVPPATPVQITLSTLTCLKVMLICNVLFDEGDARKSGAR